MDAEGDPLGGRPGDDPGWRPWHSTGGTPALHAQGPHETATAFFALLAGPAVTCLVVLESDIHLYPDRVMIMFPAGAAIATALLSATMRNRIGWTIGWSIAALAATAFTAAVVLIMAFFASFYGAF